MADLPTGTVSISGPRRREAPFSVWDAWPKSRAIWSEGRPCNGRVSLAGNVAWAQGDYGMARTAYEEGLAISREMGYRWEAGWALQGLGNVASSQGEYGTARAFFEESLAVRREIGEKRGFAEGLEGLAKVAQAVGDAPRAARLLGAAQSVRQEIGTPLPPAERAEYDRCVVAVRAVLNEARAAGSGVSQVVGRSAAAEGQGDSEVARKAAGAESTSCGPVPGERKCRDADPGFAAEWASGRAMTLYDVLEYALTDTGNDTPPLVG
jgi:tetratricopeptide (TPR) repeat protein